MFEDIPEYNVIKGRSAKIHLAFFNVSHGHFRNTVRNLRRRRVDFHAVKLCIGITVLYPEQIRPAVTSDLKNTDGGIFGICDIGKQAGVRNGIKVVHVPFFLQNLPVRQRPLLVFVCGSFFRNLIEERTAAFKLPVLKLDPSDAVIPHHILRQGNLLIKGSHFFQHCIL